MDLGSLKYAPGSVKKKKRIGRGQGSGSKIRPWFEGGQMPLQRRVPKRGFTNIFKKQFQIVNLKDLDRIKKAQAITPEVLFDSGVINKKNIPVKILGEGDLKKAMDISAHAFSASAKEKIEKSGGKVVVL